MTTDLDRAGRRALMVVFVNLLLICCPGGWSGLDCARAAASGADVGTEDRAKSGGEANNDSGGEYHTPLAGKSGHATFLGHPADIPGYDRGHMTSITLGGSILQPKQGGTLGVPVGALYLRRIEARYRTRDTISIFVNELEYDKSFGDFDIVARFENSTLPFDQTEEVRNQEIKATSLVWGSAIASLG
ncbi:MAG TPA: hypothetical protein VN642_18235, partial [Dongiaceae bacterium]|nr:hypothetical protein [Dongiaceae bacterium]